MVGPMLQKSHASNIIKCGTILCMAWYLFNLMGTLHLRSSGDDLLFFNKSNNLDVFSYVSSRYMNWSGRVTPELLMFSTISTPLIWKIGIVSSVLLASFSMCRIALGKFNFPTFTLCFVLFLSIPEKINSDASWWITGFYNYLLPISIALYSFSVVASRTNNKIEKFMALLFTLFFPYVEQAGISFVIALTLYVIYFKQYKNMFMMSLLALSAVNFSICIFAPGNALRYANEIWHWYPQYQTYSIFNKLSLGVDKLHQVLTLPFNTPVLILSIATFVLGADLRVKPFSVMVSLIVLSTFVAISLASSVFGSPSQFFFFKETLSSDIWSSAKAFLSYLYILIVLLSILLLLLSLNIEKTINSLPIAALLIGLMTVTVMGLSPTVYISNLRVDLFFEVMCIVSASYLANKIVQIKLIK